MGNELRDEQLNICQSGHGSAPIRVGVIGDSLAAKSHSGYAQYLQGALERAGTSATIIDRSSAGKTSAYGPPVARELVALDNPPQIVVLELGGNDVLDCLKKGSFAGFRPENVKANLQETISILKENGIQVVLSGMQADMHVPEPLRSRFNDIYADLAADNNIILDPLIYESVLAGEGDIANPLGLNRDYMQNDYVHFNRDGAELTAEGLVPEIQEAASRLPAPPCP